MAYCYYHSSREAAYTCRDCQKSVCEACVMVVEGVAFCQMCWESYIVSMHQQAASEEEGLVVPWQRWTEIGILRAFWETCTQIAVQPGRFFEKIQAKSDLGTPLFFALICTLLFWFPPNVVYMQYLLPVFEQFSGQLLEGSAQPVAAQAPVGPQNRQTLNTLQIFLLPLNYVFIHIIVMAWMQQALVTLFKGKAGFPATLQIRCYTAVANVLWFVPIIGILLAEAASIALSMRGFQVVQQLPTKRAFFIAVTPLLVSILATFLTLGLSFAL